MFLPALVAVAGLLVMAWSLPATAAPAPAEVAAQGPRYVPALEVTIDSLTPGHLPTEAPVRITGSVTNADDIAWQAVKMYSFLDDVPMVSQAQLAEAAEVDPLLDVGQRIVEEPAADLVGNLEPGQTERFSLTVSSDYLNLTAPGVYWFGVHAMGQSAEQPRDDVADGRARTFLPYVPAGTPGEVKTALVLPIRHFLPFAEDGSLEQLDHWQRTLSVGGRLKDLVNFAASAGSTPVTWLVDPAVPDAIRRLAAGNPPVSLGPSAAQPTDEATTETPSGSPSASSGPEANPTRERELTAQELAVQESALSWLGRFQEAVRGDEVLGLPYGDLDVAAAAELDPDLYELARGRPSDVLTDWGVTSQPTVASPSGYLNSAGLELLPDDTSVLITDRMFGTDPPGVAQDRRHHRRGAVLRRRGWRPPARRSLHLAAAAAADPQRGRGAAAEPGPPPAGGRHAGRVGGWRCQRLLLRTRSRLAHAHHRGRRHRPRWQRRRPRGARLPRHPGASPARPALVLCGPRPDLRRRDPAEPAEPQHGCLGGDH